jgi:Fe-S-cluster containining protein
MGKVKNKPKWKCEQCGKCCKFIVIPVQENAGLEVLGYLAAHGIAYENGRLIIPARCDFLTEENTCAIHSAKFSNCRLGGKRECKNAKKDYETLKNLQAPE